MIGEVPVVWNVPIVIISHRELAVLAARSERRDEAVHLATVELTDKGDRVMADIGDRRFADMPWLYITHGWVVGIDRHFHIGRKPVSTRISTEVVVKRVVLLHDEDQVLNGRLGLRSRCLCGSSRLNWRYLAQAEHDCQGECQGLRALHGRTS